MVILDLMVEEKCFLWEVSDLEWTHELKGEKVQLECIDRLCELYFSFIKKKAEKYTNKGGWCNVWNKLGYVEGKSVTEVIVEVQGV